MKAHFVIRFRLNVDGSFFLRRVMGGEKVFELSNIVNEAWKLPKLLMIKPDHATAKGSNFVDNLRNQGIEAAAAKRAAKEATKKQEA